MWYAEYINFASNHGWISGYSDGTFRPDAPITRAEAAKILANAIQLDIGRQIEAGIGAGTVIGTGTGTIVNGDTIIQSSFEDVPSDSIFVPYIESLRQAGVMR